MPSDRARLRRQGLAAAFVAGLLLAGLAIAAGMLIAAVEGPGLYLAGGGLALGVILLWSRLTIVAARDSQLRRLTNALEASIGAPSAALPLGDRRDLDPMIARLQRALAALLSRRAAGAANDEARLSAILAALPQPLLVVNDQGLVTLVNRPAMDLFGADRLRPGTSAFDVVDRSSLAERRRAATEDPSAVGPLCLIDGSTHRVRVRELADHGGAVIAFDDVPAAAAGLAHALDLHDPSPPVEAPKPETPLERLNVMVLDCETTGLNVGLDRLLSIGAVRVHGTRILRQETLDWLIDPGEPIAPASIAIHGISDAMVWGEKTIGERWPEIEPWLRDCVIVGHNIGFDLTLLEIELRRAGIKWQRPLSLCTLQLAAALEPELRNLNLEALAEAYGIEVAGRHTALGDALLTAEIYVRLVALMRQRGDTTLSDAQARAATSRSVIRQQQAAGW